MAHELIIDGALYISAQRAAEIAGYTRDYVGQLARSEKIKAQRVGNRWFIRKDSLAEHKALSGDSSEPMHQTHAMIKEDNTVGLHGKTYVPSSKAASELGYHHDYVAQLARGGTISAQNINNRWYVDIEALKYHKREKDALLAKVQATAVGLRTMREAEVKDEKRAPSQYSYTQNKEPLLPQLVQHSKSVPDVGDIVHAIPIRRIRLDETKTSFQQVRLPYKKKSSRRYGLWSVALVLGAFAIFTVNFDSLIGNRVMIPFRANVKSAQEIEMTKSFSSELLATLSHHLSKRIIYDRLSNKNR